MLLFVLAQISASPPPAPPPPPAEHWSILATPACGKTVEGATIVVCAPSPATAPRLPLPGERGPPDHGLPSNPNLDGVGAMAVEATPCAATQWGCTVGVGPPVMPLIAGAVGLAKGAFARKPDRTRRVPIDLGEPAR